MASLGGYAVALRKRKRDGRSASCDVAHRNKSSPRIASSPRRLMRRCSMDAADRCSGLRAAEAAMTEQLAMRTMAAATVLKRSPPPAHRRPGACEPTSRPCRSPRASSPRWRAQEPPAAAAAAEEEDPEDLAGPGVLGGGQAGPEVQEVPEARAVLRLHRCSSREAGRIRRHRVAGRRSRRSGAEQMG